MIITDIADLQSSPDWRNIPVDRVGVRGIRHPFTFEDFTPQRSLHRQQVVGRFDMLVSLAKDVKGTHMSRFIEILNEEDTILSIPTLPYWLESISTRLHANHAFFQVQFPYFIKKRAPSSGAQSYMDYDVCVRGVLSEKSCETYVTMVVPVTSLCPCSKEIADYGAHNQRSHVVVTVRAAPTLSIMEMIQLVESKASSELFALLKRADEKIVTERAYDNPKFVEDMVRDIATVLENTDTVLGYRISSENFESIHNHSAFAEIDKLHAKSKQTEESAELIDACCV